jgi:hypothetical protein
MPPRIVFEPITGLRWVATSGSSVLLSWLPTIYISLAFGLGVVVGHYY